MEVYISGLGTANPPLRVAQEDAYRAYEALLSLSDQAKRLLKRLLVNNKSIGYRFLAMDTLLDALDNDQDQLIERFRKFAVPTSAQAARSAMSALGAQPKDIDGIVVNTCTGYLCPGLTSYLSEDLKLRPDIRPLELQGMGCGGAIPNLEASRNQILANPGSMVLSVATEMCSATIYLDEAPDILVTNSLFGDGAAAAVLTDVPGPGRQRLVDFASALHPADRAHLYYRTENSKLRNVLSKDVPEVGAKHGQAVVDRLLSNNRLSYDDISHWIVHPGGERVIDAFRDGLGLMESDLAPSRKILYEYGNMSSASVLFVLQEVLDQRSPTAGEFGVMCSFGAGFSAFAALLEFS